MMLVSRERQGGRGQEGRRKKEGRKKVKAISDPDLHWANITCSLLPGTVVGKAKAHQSRPTRSGDYFMYGVLVRYLRLLVTCMTRMTNVTQLPRKDRPLDLGLHVEYLNVLTPLAILLAVRYFLTSYFLIFLLLISNSNRLCGPLESPTMGGIPPCQCPKCHATLPPFVIMAMAHWQTSTSS